MWNSINLHLDILRDSLFISSHSLIFKSSEFIRLSRSTLLPVLLKLPNVDKRVVSSAYDMKLKARLDWEVINVD